MCSLKSPCTTSYRSLITTIALNCLVLEKIVFFAFWRQTDRQTARQTNKQMDSTDPLSCSRCHEHWLNNLNGTRQSYSQKVVHGLPNRAIFHDLERPQTPISRSGHSLTLNISQMANDAAIVITMEGEQETVPKLSNSTIFNDLE